MRMDSDRDEAEYGGDYYYTPDDDDDAPEEGRRAPDDGTYWRRRFLILCGGVAALGACAWLFPAAHQPSARASAAASAAAAAAAKRQALPPAALASAWPGPRPTASPSPARAVYPTASAAQAKQKTGPTASPGSSAAASAAAGAGGAPRCAPGDIVLSLFTSQPGYDPGTPPAFNVYAVSTSGSACTLPYGAGSVQVVVTRDGQVVWNSAACKPPAAQPVRFTPGVPQVLTMTWNRKAPGPAGCAGSLPAGGTGTLDAVALEGSQSSAVRTFKLDR
jgi:hypothetical protein